MQRSDSARTHLAGDLGKRLSDSLRIEARLARLAAGFAQFPNRDDELVNAPLTMMSKVNTHCMPNRRSNGEQQMKKRTRGFWNWILGSGWEGGGSNG